MVGDGVQRTITQAEQRDLVAVHEHGGAPVGFEIGQPAGGGPYTAARLLENGHRLPSTRCKRWVRSSGRAGRSWPRSGTNITLSSGSSLLTNVRKRRSRSGSASVAFHSHSYVSTWRAMS